MSLQIHCSKDNPYFNLEHSSSGAPTPWCPSGQTLPLPNKVWCAVSSTASQSCKQRCITSNEMKKQQQDKTNNQSLNADAITSR